MPSWDKDTLTTQIDWQQGKTYYVKPVKQGTRGEFKLTKAKPKTKGSGTFVDAIPADISTEHYTYRCRKSEKGRVLITRKLRDGKRRPTKATRKAPPRVTPPPKKAPKAKRKAKRRKATAKQSERQTIFPFTFFVR